jgi:hypothetical protein
MGAERRVTEALDERAGVAWAMLRLRGGHAAVVHLRDPVIEGLGIHAPGGLRVLFGVHAGSVADTPSLNLPRR